MKIDKLAGTLKISHSLLVLAASLASQNSSMALGTNNFLVSLSLTVFTFGEPDGIMKPDDLL